MPGLRQRSVLQRGSHKNLAPQRKRIIMQNLGLTPVQYRKQSLAHKLSVLGKVNGGRGMGVRGRALLNAGKSASNAGVFKWKANLSMDSSAFQFKRPGHSSHGKVAHRGEGPVRYGTAKAVKGKSRAAKAGTQGAFPGREARKQKKK